MSRQAPPDRPAAAAHPPGARSEGGRGGPPLATEQRWFHNAVIYSLSVPHFFDADGDGVGDLAGVHRRLDHVVSLGASCVWLLPFLDSPRRDFGYDVRDGYAVDARLGDLGRLAELIRGAHARGLRIVVDLSLQHTAVEHPWFREARRGRDDPRHDYYVWRDERPPPGEGGGQVTWVGRNDSWSFDGSAGRWYRHRFYAHEPDLNMLNPEVRAEIRRAVALWLQLGVDGLRIDAGALMARAAADAYGGDEIAFMRELRRTAAALNPAAVLLVEADLRPEELAGYFDGGQGGLLLLNFFLAGRLFLALAREAGEPLAAALEVLPPGGPDGHWANFLRNHDELDLERLSEGEREDVFRRFAPEQEMRIFGRGIRRRLGPMLGGDGPLLRLAYAALLSLPGSPVVLWGDELPVGEDLSRPDRDAVRSAMPWTGDDGFGFSAAEDARPSVPFAAGGARVNVADARRDEGSLLNWLAAAIRARREAPHIGWGSASVVRCDRPEVLAVRHDWNDEAVVIAANFAREPVQVRLPGCGDLAATIETFADHDYGGAPRSLADGLALEGFGYRWFRGLRR